MNNKLRKALLDQTLTLGAWIQIGHPAVAEIFAGAGFDWICVDLEHGIIDLETMAHLFRAIPPGGAVPVARLPQSDPVWIHRCLDAGAQGLILPMIHSPQQARQAVAWAKYPPRGERGFGYCRANGYGMDFHSAAGAANDEIALIMQIEHRDGIDNLEDILQVPGVDAVLIGPYDLSGSYGKVGQFDAPEIRRALDTFLRLCKKHKKAAGFHLVHPTPESIDKAVSDGYSVLALGLDVVFLAEASAHILQPAKTAAP